jgi:hypothetical protein
LEEATEDLTYSGGVPRIIDYEIVLQRLTAEGLKCHYPNGGAFGFRSEALVRGWIGPPDETIKPAARAVARKVGEPYEANLAAAARRAWQLYLPGDVWVMPAAHWAYELNDGSRDWQPEAVQKLGLDPGLLKDRNSAAAIEFSPVETQKFRDFVQRLLERLQQSDFTLAFAGRGTICTVHHHKQLWWVTIDPHVMGGLDELVAGGGCGLGQAAEC